VTVEFRVCAHAAAIRRAKATLNAQFPFVVGSSDHEPNQGAAHASL